MGRRPRLKICPLECVIYEESAYAIAREIYPNEVTHKHGKVIGLNTSLDRFDFNADWVEFVCKEPNIGSVQHKDV